MRAWRSSTSAVAIFGAVALFIILRNRIGGIYGRDLLDSLWRITLASGAAQSGRQGAAHYCASKAGVVMFTKVLAL